MDRCVIFFNNNKDAALLLSNIKRDKDNNIISGYVENGAWKLKISGNTLKATTEDGYVMNTDTFEKITEIPVPNDKKGDYNYFINWARTK